MNQAVQFIDRIDYNEKTQQLTFYAQVSGLMVECIIDMQSLTIADIASAQHHFELRRFDYEELAEQLIEDEEYNSTGQVAIKMIS
ncbi:MAG: DUF1488 domain-containing protein [Pseudoalteromonas sp.]|uniref:DUF1488 domain-containing protein n=1 Tax=unclassified Pseudoalteromonas TaxID=194690 RepID=UPI003F99BF51